MAHYSGSYHRLDLYFFGFAVGRCRGTLFFLANGGEFLRLTLLGLVITVLRYEHVIGRLIDA